MNLFIVQKLAETGWWGWADATILKTETIALVYSTAEYGALIWSNSAYSEKVDTHLNSAVLLINRVIQSTRYQGCQFFQIQHH